MSLLNAILDLAGDKGPAVIDGLVSRAKGIADDQLSGPERDLAKSALDDIGGQSENLAHLGSAGVVSLVAYVGFGRKNEAKLAYLMRGATFEERRLASIESTDETVRERINRERAWDDVLETLEGIGAIALKLLPLLLAAA